MKTLYYVACYSFRGNEWARYLVTAPDPETARTLCEYDEFKAKRVEPVCLTPDDVNVEV